MSEQFTREVIARRAAREVAGFLLPHLRSGMRLIDCGCGPGNVTADLAGVVDPGDVVGIDISERDLESGRALVRDRGIGNVTFQVASVYELPFPDGSFDVAFAHALLQHLGDPLAALKEMRRVLRPGGLAGIADPAWHRALRAPTNPILDAWDALRTRTIAHNGGSPFYASNQRALLREAGFRQTEGGAWMAGADRSGAAGTLDTTRSSAQAHLARLRGSVEQLALQQGWASQEELDAMADALVAWGDRPDAFYALPICWGLGWA